MGLCPNNQVLREAFATKRMSLSHKAVVDWGRRWIIIRMLILKSQPHILVFQEMDHMAEAQEHLGLMGYDCALAGEHGQVRTTHPISLIFNNGLSLCNVKRVLCNVTPIATENLTLLSAVQVQASTYGTPERPEECGGIPGAPTENKSCVRPEDVLQLPEAWHEEKT